jgi:hypothetical protein
MQEIHCYMGERELYAFALSESSDGKHGKSHRSEKLRSQTIRELQILTRFKAVNQL